MAHSINWKAMSISHKQPLPWMIIDLTWWPEYKSPVVSKPSGASSKPGKSDQTVTVSFLPPQGPHYMWHVKSSLLFSVHLLLFCSFKWAHVHSDITRLFPRFLTDRIRLLRCRKVQTIERVWFQISTLSSCRSSHRCPFLSWPFWHRFLNYSQQEEWCKWNINDCTLSVRFSVWNKALLHRWVEAVHKEAINCPFYMLIRPCLVVRGAPQSCKTTK